MKAKYCALFLSLSYSALAQNIHTTPYPQTSEELAPALQTTPERLLSIALDRKMKAQQRKEALKELENHIEYFRDETRFNELFKFFDVSDSDDLSFEAGQIIRNVKFNGYALGIDRVIAELKKPENSLVKDYPLNDDRMRYLNRLFSIFDLSVVKDLDKTMPPAREFFTNSLLNVKSDELKISLERVLRIMAQPYSSTSQKNDSPTAQYLRKRFLGTQSFELSKNPNSASIIETLINLEKTPDFKQYRAYLDSSSYRVASKSMLALQRSLTLQASDFKATPQLLEDTKNYLFQKYDNHLNKKSPAFSEAKNESETNTYHETYGGYIMEALGTLASQYSDKEAFLTLLKSLPEIESKSNPNSAINESEYPAIKTFRSIKFFNERNLSDPKTQSFIRLVESMTLDEKILFIEKVSTLLKAGYYKNFRLDAAMTLRIVVGSQLPKNLTISDLELSGSITKEKAAELRKLKSEGKLTDEILYSTAISSIESEAIDKGKIEDLGPPSGSLSLGSVFLGALFPVTYFGASGLSKGSISNDVYAEDKLPEALDYFEKTYLDEKLKNFVRKWEAYRQIKEGSITTQKTK